jgi:hypothetical protein
MEGAATANCRQVSGTYGLASMFVFDNVFESACRISVVC